MSQTLPDAFLFDIGNVIITFDYDQVVHRLAPHSRLPAGEILPALKPLGAELEAGRISGDTFLEESAKRLGFSGSIEQLHQRFADIFALNAPMAHLIEDLSGQVALYLLSNTNEIHARFFETRFPVFSHFQGRIYSHEVGCLKPDPAIYAIAIERLNLNPAKTVYIDDLPENCAAGRTAGFLAVPYAHQDHDAFLREVAPYLP